MPRRSRSQAKPRGRSSERAAFTKIVQVLERWGADLRQHPDVVALRPGYRFRNGWLVDPPEPVIVASVLRKQTGLSQSHQLPREFRGIPIDVTTATPLQQLQHAQEPSALVAALTASSEAVAGDDLALPGWELLPPSAAGLAALALEPYVPPPALKLAEVRDAMTVTCCVSPEHGWSELQPFLTGVHDRLTIAMYDFTAPHILKSLKNAMVAATGRLRLILDPKVALPSARQKPTSNKRNDVREDVVETDLHTALGSRFNFTWAAVTSKDKVSGGLFPNAYHIKVAVRDGGRFWLSSGNWQSSNQPDISSLNLPIGDLQQRYNREWHVIIDHPGLASLYEKFIEWDIRQARPFQISPDEHTEPDLSVPPAAAALAAKTYQPTPPQTFTFTANQPLRVQPLLTPDNYADHVIRLIRGAKHSILFQNQYIKPSKNPDPAFTRALDALRQAQRRGITVQIILRDQGDVRAMLEALQYARIDTSQVRMQSGCHNKGIIIDSKIAVVGSHNWSSAGVTRNRDASLVFHDKGIAGYFATAFRYDWQTLAHRRVAAETAPPQLATAASQGPTLSWSDYYED